MIKEKKEFIQPVKKLGIKEKIINAGEVIIYGGGTVGQDVILVLEKMGVSVRCIIDAKILKIDSFNGIPILKPNDLSLSKELKETTSVIVGIFNAYVDMPTIHSQLEADGWKNVISFLDFYDDFSKELGNRFWLTDKGYYQNHKKNLAKACSILEDEKSQDLFKKIVDFRYTGDYSLLDKPEVGTQYFPPDIPSWGDKLRMVDCGAYDGDSLKQVQSLGYKVEAYAGFEPDLLNYAELAKSIQSGDLNTSYTIWPCGVWSHTCQLRFSSGHGSGSNINVEGESIIQCTSLDEAIITFEPNLIKMDIEGAEYNALLGASKIIHKYRPGLAVCLYHEPSHLWRIPLLINNWNINYKLYIRCHCFNGFELVLYALPY